MASMILKSEVEATPEVVIMALMKSALSTRDAQFPYPKDTLVNLKPDVLASINGVPGMPSLIIMAGLGSPLGMVAIHKLDGEITVAYLAESQVESVFTFPAA
jgi:hypothetical protein